MRKIKFIVDFATRLEGDVWEDCDSLLACHLVNEDKVAVYDDETIEAEPIKAKKSK